MYLLAFSHAIKLFWETCSYSGLVILKQAWLSKPFGLIKLFKISGLISR